MAEGRMLKKRVSYSKKYASLKNWRARELYLLMLPHLDVDGRLEADPQLIKGQIVPLLSYTTRQIQVALEQLYEVGLIILYKANNDQYLEYNQFRKFNKIRDDREAKSEIPSPLPEDARQAPPQVKLSLSKVKRSKEKEKERFLEFVFLTTGEHQKLVSQFGAKTTAEKITALNDYIGSKGKRYVSHYHTILTWARKDGTPTVAARETTAKKRERDMASIREEYQEYLESKTTQALRDIKKDGGHLAGLCGWLIDDILVKRKGE